MANYFARKAGNIDDVDVWATTPSGTAADVWSTFTSADVLHSNSFAITVNVSTTVGTVRNDTANSATAGGNFTLSNGVTLTANVQAGTATCVTFAGTVGNSASLVGNTTGGGTASVQATTNTSTGTLNITGNVTGGSATGAEGARNTSTGTLNITGNVTGGSASQARGASNNTGTLNITGNVTGGTTAADAVGAHTFGAGTTNITGDVTASTGAGASTVAGTTTVTGTISASSSVAGLVGTSGAALLSGPFIAHSSGIAPLTHFAWRWAVSLNNQTYMTVPTSDLLATRNLVTPDNATNFPSASDVRSGTTFGISNALTGTCAVPSAASVATGVPVDNTTGTASLTPADFWNALTSGMTTSGSIGARLKNAATLDSTGQQLAAALSPA